MKRSVSDRQADGSNHEAIHAPSHDVLYDLAGEARLAAKLRNPGFIHEDPTCVYTSL